jgi:hypothetical protein
LRDEIESSFGHAKGERRSRRRAICNLQVRFRLDGHAGDGDAVARIAIMRNLSEIGAFLETDPLPVGSRLLMKIQNEPHERTAEVVWLEDPGPSARMRAIRGVGIRFLAAIGATP